MIFGVVACSVHPVADVEMMIGKDREAEVSVGLYGFLIGHTAREETSHHSVVPETVSPGQGV